MKRQDERGMSLIELTIGMAITALLASVLASLISTFVWLPSHRGDKAAVAEDLQFAQSWITRDANAADTFVAGTSPTYGTFSWSDYTGASKVDYAVIYSYDATNGYLMREERQNDATVSTFAVARHLSSAGDVTFGWNPSTYSLSVLLTATVTTGTAKEGVTTTSRTATINAALRPRAELLVSAPGAVPVPTPLPGSQSYGVAANPTLLTGSYVSGGATQLQTTDNTFYVADSTVGQSKEMVFTVQSESLTLPSTISQIELRFVGQSNRTGVSLNFYVKDSAAGFPAIGDSGFTFTSTGENRTHVFYLSSAALSYVTSLPDRRVDLKVNSSGNLSHRLSSDQILFIASP